MLNATVLDVRTGKTPYEKVFRSQPITPVPKTKFVGNKVVSVTDGDGDGESSAEDQSDVQHVPQDEFVSEEIVEHIHHDDVNAGD